MRVQSYADGLARAGALQAARATLTAAAPDGRSRGRRNADRQKRIGERDPGRQARDATGAAFDNRPAADPHAALASTLARLALASGQDDAQTSPRLVIAAYAEVE